MARRKGFLAAMAQMEREAQRRQAAQQRAQAATTRRAVAAQRAYQRASQADERERKRLYLESRAADVELQNGDLAEQVQALERLLADGLKQDNSLDFEALKVPENIPVWNPGQLEVPETPPPHPPAVPDVGGLSKLSRSAKERHAAAVVSQHEGWRVARDAHQTRERNRIGLLNAAWSEHQARLAAEQRERLQQHADINALRSEYLEIHPEAVMACMGLVLGRSLYPDDFPMGNRLAYLPESRQLVVEYNLPNFTVIPEIAAYRYVKSSDKVSTTVRPATQRRALYASVIA